jgi:hypothetical protein
VDYWKLTPEELLIECLKQIQDYSDQSAGEHGLQQAGPQSSGVPEKSQSPDPGQSDPFGVPSLEPGSLLLVEPKTSRLQ